MAEFNPFPLYGVRQWHYQLDDIYVDVRRNGYCLNGKWVRFPFVEAVLIWNDETAYFIATDKYTVSINPLKRERKTAVHETEEDEPTALEYLEPQFIENNVEFEIEDDELTFWYAPNYYSMDKDKRAKKISAVLPLDKGMQAIKMIKSLDGWRIYIVLQNDTHTCIAEAILPQDEDGELILQYAFQDERNDCEMVLLTEYRRVVQLMSDGTISVSNMFN
jgi:hypothetical protein